MRFLRRQTGGATVIEHAVIEGARLHRAIERGHGLFERLRRQIELPRKIGNRRSGFRRKHRRHEEPGGLRIDNRVRNLIGLLRDETSPDRVALRPEILAFVIKPPTVFVDDDPERYAVEARHDAPVELRGARIDGDGVELRRIAGPVGGARLA